MGEEMTERLFPIACGEAFSRVQALYEFGPPEYERIGREEYVRYRRGMDEIWISSEGGLQPDLAIVHPVREGEPGTPWVSVDGVARTHRYPRLYRVGDYDPSDRASVSSYLASMAASLEEKEEAFLTTSSSAS